MQHGRQVRRPEWGKLHDGRDVSIRRVRVRREVRGDERRTVRGRGAMSVGHLRRYRQHVRRAQRSAVHRERRLQERCLRDRCPLRRGQRASVHEWRGLPQRSPVSAARSGNTSTADSNCAAGEYCDATARTCAAVAANGQPCTRATMCSSITPVPERGRAKCGDPCWERRAPWRARAERGLRRGQVREYVHRGRRQTASWAVLQRAQR